MKRTYEDLLREYLGLFPCVGIIGPRQCGKTTLLGTLPKGWRRFDLERHSDLDVAQRDPDLFLRMNPSQVAIDEAQMLPELFPALRVAIDAHRGQVGRFVITGSSSPHLLRSVSETLAGRIGLIEMAPFSWSEVHPRPSGPTMALLADADLKPADLVAALSPRATIAQAHDYWFRGGYPEPWLKADERFRQVWMEQYVQTYLYRDVGRLFPALNQAKFRQFLQLLAGLSGTVLNYADVARTLGIAQPTARDYFEIAHGTFLWRRLPPYERNAMKRIVKHPKGYLRDSGLLHHLLRQGDLEAALRHPQMGHSWEAMVIEEILRQLAGLGHSADYYFYRTSAGAEVDLILEGAFGLLPVEIKYSQTVSGRDLRNLKDFVAERSCRLGVVINNDEQPRLYDENLVGIPFTHL
jgi:predicted AAA+ superfamily ATPase